MDSNDRLGGEEGAVRFNGDFEEWGLEVLEAEDGEVGFGPEVEEGGGGGGEEEEEGGEEAAAAAAVAAPAAAVGEGGREGFSKLWGFGFGWGMWGVGVSVAWGFLEDWERLFSWVSSLYHDV